MSKMNILEMHKSLKQFAETVLTEADKTIEDAKENVKEAKRLEPALLERIEEKNAAMQAAKQEEAEAVEAAPAPVETVVAEAKETVEAAAPVEEAPKKKKTVAKKQKEDSADTLLEDKKEEKKEKVEKTERQMEQKVKVEEAKKPKKAAKAEAVEKPAKKEETAKPKAAATPKKASNINVFIPDMKPMKPQIRVVRSAEDEAEEQKKRDAQRKKTKETTERAAERPRNAAGRRQPREGDTRQARPGQATRQPREGGTQERKPRRDGAAAGGSTAPAAGETRRPVVKRAPSTQKRQSTYDARRKNSEDEIAARRRRAAINESASRGDDEYRRRRNRKRAQKEQKTIIEPIVIENAIITGDTVSIKVLSERIGKPAAEIIKKLFLLGMMTTINSEIDFDTAALVASEYDITLEQKLEQTAEDVLAAGADESEEDDDNLEKRPPVVTVMGHVDHGKTSLLDMIRKAKVQEGEAGGITQHIGAYMVDLNGEKITFLDTPGHEAFTAMRARGAQATDIAILVVAADDGVMPQTIEAINHAKSAGVPVIVAINKMDLQGANPDRVKQELTEYGLVAEEWGGDTIMVPVSALTGEGIDTLLEMILLVADVEELRANPDRMARGIIIEARLDRGRGPVATVLVQNGTLRVQDTIVAGMAAGRVRAMVDDNGNSIKEAGPSMPVEVVGFSDVPDAGDVMHAVEQNSLSRQVVEERRERQKAEKLKTISKVSLDDLFTRIAEGQIQDLNLVVKADVQGSVEAVTQSLEKLSNEEVRVRVVHGGVGAISESDVMLASASNAIIIGFNVRPDASVTAAAERENVDIRLYRVIYNAIEDVTKAMTGMLAPEYVENVIGHAEVRQTFKVSAVGTIAGCYVQDGKMTRNADVRLLRDGVVIYEGKLSSLKRFQDDVREVASGYECGLSLENFNDIKEGDVIEASETVEVARTE